MRWAWLSHRSWLDRMHHWYWLGGRGPLRLGSSLPSLLLLHALQQGFALSALSAPFDVSLLGLADGIGEPEIFPIGDLLSPLESLELRLGTHSRHAGSDAVLAPLPIILVFSFVDLVLQVVFDFRLLELGSVVPL